MFIKYELNGWLIELYYMITYLNFNPISFIDLKMFCLLWLRGSTSCSTKTKPRSSKRPKRPTALCSFYLVCSAQVLWIGSLWRPAYFSISTWGRAFGGCSRFVEVPLFLERKLRERREKNTLVYLLYLESLCYNVSVSSEKRRNVGKWRSY